MNFFLFYSNAWNVYKLYVLYIPVYNVPGTYKELLLKVYISEVYYL